jgi:hypothetical protein
MAEPEHDAGVALAAHLLGLGLGMATIISALPAVLTLLRLLV